MLKLFSPAKINLFLRITGKRLDGYHQIASLFQTISLHDTLEYHFDEQDSLTCTDDTIPTDHSNLVFKAVDLFRKKTGLNFDLKVRLEKKIPCEAGFGGGSSNAATTLWALNQMCKTAFSEMTLANWSAEIGSDIPFFFSHGSAYCTGRGEVVRPISALNKQDLWLIKPKEGLSTASIYKRLKVTELPNVDPEIALEKFLMGTPHYFNDLEYSAFQAMPSLVTLKQKLKECGFSIVLMTGSGSAFFCLGQGSLPDLKGFFCQKASFVTRSSNQWYLNAQERNENL